MIQLMQVANSLGAARPIVLVGVAGLAVALSGGCRRQAPAPAQGPLCAPPPVSASSTKGTKGTTTGVTKDGDPAEQPPRPLRRCFPEQPAWVDAPVADLLDKAALLFDKGDYTGTLACAEEAARAAPRSVEAHHNRAIALMRLDRLDEARDALELALALAPDDPETLEAAADLQINQLPPSGDRSALGLEYARRGSRHVPRRDVEEVARLALLEGQALIDLGRAAEALRRIDAALRRAAALRGGGLRARAWRCSSSAGSTRRGRPSPRSWPRRPITRTRSTTWGSSRSARGTRRPLDATWQRRRPPIPSRSRRRRRSRSPTSRPGSSARWRRCPPIFVATSPASTCRPPICPDLEDLTAEKPPLSPTILGLFRGIAARLRRPGRGAHTGRAVAQGARGPAPAVGERARAVRRR